MTREVLGTRAQSHCTASLPHFKDLIKYGLSQNQFLFFKSETRDASLTGWNLSDREMKTRAKDDITLNGSSPKNESSVKRGQQIAQMVSAT